MKNSGDRLKENADDSDDLSSVQGSSEQKTGSIIWNAKEEEPESRIHQPVVWNLTPEGLLQADEEQHVTLNQNMPLPLPKTRGLLAILDRFLKRRLFSVVVFYFSAMITLSAVLIITNVPSAQALTETISDAGNSGVLNAWMYSIMTLLTIVFAFMIIYTAVRRRKKAW